VGEGEKMNLKATVVIALLAVVFLHALALRAQESSAAATEFNEIKSRLKVMMGSTPPDKIYSESRAMLESFIGRYPDSREAGQARLILAQIGIQLGKDEEALGYMEDFLSSKYADENPDVKIQVEYMIGLSYINLERFDEAQKVLGSIAGSAENINPKLRRSAKMQLGRIESLKKLKIGMPAIEFEAEKFGGGRIKLKDFKGKVVLLDFWATWCAPCRQEMPNVKKIYEDFHRKGFEIIGISLDREKYKLEEYIKSNKISWPQIFDGNAWDSKIGRLYAVASIPNTFLLDREGKIRYKNLRGEELRKAVAELVNEGK
jgi:peroxiredoxin